MKLSIKDRLVLLAIMPQESSRAIIGLVMRLQKSLSLSQKEQDDIKYEVLGTCEKCGLSQEGRAKWDEDVAETLDKDVVIPAAVAKVIWDALKKLDREEKLRGFQIEVFDKIQAVMEPKPDDRPIEEAKEEKSDKKKAVAVETL